VNTRKIAGSSGNLKTQRGEMSQAELGARAGVSARRINEWESVQRSTGTNIGTPKRGVTLSVIKRLAHVLGVNWRTLVK
jgi:transcriptional regulator with XRE-family HTH domain